MSEGTEDMEQPPPFRAVLNGMVGSACFVIVIAGMKLAAPLLVPLLLSAFIAIPCTPPLFWLQRKGIPTFISVGLIITSFFCFALVFSALLGASIADFLSKLPDYQKGLQAKQLVVMDWLASAGIQAPIQLLKGRVHMDAVVQLVGVILAGLGNLLTDSLFIFLTILFILLETSTFPGKLQRAFGSQPSHTLSSFSRFNSAVKKYLWIKSMVSLLTGSIIGIWLTVLGIDYPVLWGTFAFLLNFVPNIGSIIAAVPAVMLAFLQTNPFITGLTIIGYLIVNMVMENLVEPRLMGQGLGLSTLVVFLSLVFWGWVLGPVGMILSVPLTIIVKIAFESDPKTHWLAILLDGE